MSIESWMPSLKTLMAGVSGISQVHIYSDLPGTIQALPSIIILPREGTQIIGSTSIAIHQVQATLYFTNQILPEAYGKGVPFIALVRNAIAANVTLTGAVSYCLPPDEGPFYEGPGSIKYGEKDLLGIIFHLMVKEQETLTVA